MEETLVIVKPDAFEKRYTWDIVKTYSDAGLDVVKIKIETPTKEICEKHYKEHKGKPFYNDLIDFLSSGPVCIMILRGENAISRVRKLNGNTDPLKADEGTIRRKYGENKSRNAVHASDSLESAQREIELWFKKSDTVYYGVMENLRRVSQG